MATVVPERPSIRRPDSERRVRHPLHTLRGYIRFYVTVEGALIALIYLALWFWIGLALDYGSFWLFGGFDWIQELQGIAPEGQPADMIVRGVLLGGLVAGLVAVVALKVILRLFREFRDSALALVLERRFPNELGDRLITAVEMADPKLAVKYGYSAALVDKTINDAADRVEQVPVRNVFNWGRLRRLSLTAAGLTLGMYLLVAGSYLGANALAGSPESAGAYAVRFYHIAAIWTERNILLMDSYWPRQAYLEIVRFQHTPDHPDEMRIGRDEQRPDLQVRAYQWLIADAKVFGGWRPLRWHDLPELLGPELPGRVNIPEIWHAWLIDLDDLAADVPAGAVPASWQGLSSGAVRKELEKEPVARGIRDAGADAAVKDLLNWKTWTLDKIALEENNGDVRHALRSEYPQAHRALQQIFEQLAELGQSASMERHFRQVAIPTLPEDVQFAFWGKTTKKSSGSDRPPKENTFFFSLGELKESVQFIVRTADFATPTKHIKLVPPPSITSLTVDKEEPAYIYYRLQGDQTPLKGKKQIFKDHPISTTGDPSTIPVPIGTNLTVTAKVDRRLKGGIRMKRPAVSEERGAVLPQSEVRLLPDRQTFVVHFPNVVRTIEFEFEFNDMDNVKGKRRILIRPIDDRAPEVFDVEMTAVLRKPRFKAEPGSRGGAADGYLITPDALIPFKGTLRDDFGLTQAGWLYDVEPVEIELVGKLADGDKLPSLVLQGNTRIRRAALLVSGLQFMPGTPALESVLPIYLTWMSRLLVLDVAQSASRVTKEGVIPLERFQMRLDERAGDEIPLNDLLQKLKQKPPERGLFKEYSLKDEDGFDVKRYLPKIKVEDPKKEAQLHYLVRLSVTATDNNVETGPSTGRNKAPFTFLVVSENELLAQIFIEEETLRERLEKVLTKLKKAQVSTSEQTAKLSVPDSDLTLVAIRADEVRKALSDTASTTREVYGDFSRILRELEVNRVGFDKGKRKIEDVRTKIVEPLEDIVNPNNGSFDQAERAVGKLYELLDEDVSKLRAADEKTLESLKQQLAPNRTAHARNALALRDKLDSLIDRLNQVLIAMEEGIAFGQLLQVIVGIERDQRMVAERVFKIRADKEKELLDYLKNLK
jgi:hypothetical protein